jgi:hypothetical protein
MERGKECEVKIVFDLKRVDLEKLFAIERLLREMGICFDTGGGCGGRDWEWDYSLQGPVKVLFKGDREQRTAERIKEFGRDVRNRADFDEQACGVPTCRECCKAACTRQ